MSEIVEDIIVGKMENKDRNDVVWREIFYLTSISNLLFLTALFNWEQHRSIL